ncbi:NERD nuclease [Planococcus antarcticus DSM 14505]|uniref:NERD nuclease n=1 Tax=Planococcus antarcticus DSM 14505 TaxID=1185653 RepID=A0ABN4RI30_9BACL|nr:nuclease-related domain-containing protein [Planococcus antarcticus]ANU10081.1 NERD nuclease [Planococcus antarcticus DSM 14505]
MIIKHREKPVKIAGYEAFLKRLSPNHPKKSAVKNNLNHAKAGYGGEVRLDGALECFDPPYAHLILQDYSLPTPFNIQVDTLVLTQSCVFLLEVKNITGKLQFKQNPSALHPVLADGKIKSYKSPITQMNDATMQMQAFLKTTGCPVPIASIIVIAHPSQIVEDAPHAARVLSAGEVNFYLSEMKLPNPILSIEELHRLGQTFLNAHQDYQSFPLAPKFQIELSEIEPGVFCPRCHLGKMERTKVAWECEICRLISRNAHSEALNDWFMLIKSSINTAECCEFIGLKSLDTAKHFLIKSGCQPVGSRRYRHYIQQQ